MVFGFLLYVPNPLCTGSTLPKPQTLMPCCREPTFSSSFLLFPLTLGISHSSLNWECTLSFLSKHQNKMWSLYAVEMATRAAGLGHVLHTVIKKKKKSRHNAKRAHHVQWRWWGEQRGCSVFPHVQINADLRQKQSSPPLPLLPSPLRLHHRLKSSPTVGEDYLELNGHYYFSTQSAFNFPFCSACENMFLPNLLLCALL